MGSEGSSRAVAIGDADIVARADLHHLLDALHALGYRVVGPTIRERAIVYEELTSIEDLPIGYTDRQEAGTYRLERRGDEALFGYAVGPQSWKRYLYPPSLRLWQAERANGGFRVTPEPQEAPKTAFLGVHACELHAIAIQDRVLLGGTYPDPAYAARRAGIFVVAVNCGQAGGTCFCVSMGTGPKAAAGFDLALTELLDGGEHRFLVEVGTQAGLEVLSAVPRHPAQDADRLAAARVVQATAAHMGRQMETADIHEVLTRDPEHPRWAEVATRCLTCGNCTMVCPTCFCTAVEDVTDLTGERAERWRRWDSCFTMDFSYIHGGSVRASAKSRYRQWLTHKLATWIDQFGTSGCVGCGRCITWCPVGIDITEEVQALRAPADEQSGQAGES
jgi:sulfhydrogenase subunit beta (sulfur reductase)